MKPPSGSMVFCPECDAENSEGSARCFLCRHDLSIRMAASPTHQGASPLRFTMASLMLAVALIAVILGVIVEAPGLGIPLLIVATPAFWRTATAAHRRRSADRPMTTPEKLAGFFASIGIAAVIAVAASAAFLAVCFASFGLASATASPPHDEMVVIGLIIGMVLGTILAVVVGVVLIRRLWKRLD